MSIARSVADVLRDHVVLELEAIDRMYLNVYVPTLQTVGAVVGYLRVHRGQRFASTATVMPMTEAFVHNIEEFVNAEGIDLIAFEKSQRKDDVTMSRRSTCGASARAKACSMSARPRRRRA
jgi:maleate cis-trans isomerase